MRRAANTDRNHQEIVNAFRGLGCSVETLHRVGHGCPDLLLGVSGLTLVVEVKAFPVHTEKGSLNAEQREWHAAWKGQKAVVRSLEEAGELVRAARELAVRMGLKESS